MPIARWLTLAGLVLLFIAAPLARAQQNITVLTGGASGVYYPLGVALSQIYARALPNARLNVQVTRASAENLNLLQAGQGDIGFALGDALGEAWKGNAEAGFATPLTQLRAVAAIYPNYIQILVAAESGIASVADLKGKRIAVGAARSGTELNARRIFKAAKLDYRDFARVDYLPFGESVELIKQGQLDATVISAGLGVAAVRDLATEIKIRILPIDPELVGRIGEPAYQIGHIPANTYNGQAAEVPTLVVQNFLVTHSGVSADTVYAMTRSMFENLDVLVAAQRSAGAIRRTSAASGSPVPFHPGAERYYREQGLLK